MFDEMSGRGGEVRAPHQRIGESGNGLLHKRALVAEAVVRRAGP